LTPEANPVGTTLCYYPSQATTLVAGYSSHEMGFCHPLSLRGEIENHESFYYPIIKKQLMAFTVENNKIAALLIRSNFDYFFPCHELSINYDILFF